MFSASPCPLADRPDQVYLTVYAEFGVAGRQMIADRALADVEAGGDAGHPLAIQQVDVQGQTVPLSALARFESRSGPEFTMRYNEYRSAQINAAAAPGYSADQARAALVDVFKQTMPSEMGYDWMGMSYQEVKAEEGVPASAIFGFSLLFVFLILAALYESWTVPFSVLLSTPVAVFGALAGAPPNVPFPPPRDQYRPLPARARPDGSVSLSAGVCLADPE